MLPKLGWQTKYPKLYRPPLATKQSITFDRQVAPPGMYPSKFPDNMRPSFPPYLIIPSIRQTQNKSRCEVVRDMLCKVVLTLCENGQTRDILEHVEHQAPKDGRCGTEAHLTIEDINQIQIEKVGRAKEIDTDPMSDQICSLVRISTSHLFSNHLRSPRLTRRKSTRGGVARG